MVDVTTEIVGANAVGVGAVVTEVEAMAIDEDAAIEVVGSPASDGPGTLVFCFGQGNFTFGIADAATSATATWTDASGNEEVRAGTDRSTTCFARRRCRTTSRSCRGCSATKESLGSSEFRCSSFGPGCVTSPIRRLSLIHI